MKLQFSTSLPDTLQSTTRSDPWLEACVYACARLVSMAMHADGRLDPSPPHACARLGSGTQGWTSCVIMHWFSAI
jgi:hypothetical protein